MLGNSWRIEIVRFILWCHTWKDPWQNTEVSSASKLNQVHSFNIKPKRTNQWTRLKKDMVRALLTTTCWKLMKTWSFRGNHSRSLTQHRTENPGHSRPHKRSVRWRPAPVSAHHSSVPKECDGETIELNAAMMATAAGTLGTDAAFELDLASG